MTDDPNRRPDDFGPFDHVAPLATTPEMTEAEATEMFESAIEQARQALRMMRSESRIIPGARKAAKNLADEAAAMSTEHWWYCTRKPTDAGTPLPEWSRSKGGRTHE